MCNKEPFWLILVNNISQDQDQYLATVIVYFSNTEDDDDDARQPAVASFL